MVSNGKESQAMLAVLIDADNAQPSVTDALMAEIAKYGIASVKRIYGDWTTPHLVGWKSIVLEYSIQPIQQFRYTTGKNATDSAMIIDAMDLLYTRRFTGFCLVSSDSDFTRLASRIREEGFPVYGFGERKTPQAFVSACDKFIYTEVLCTEEHELSSGHAYIRVPETTNALKGDAKLVNLMRRAIEAASDENGWALLSGVGTNIAKQSPEFDPRNYGYTKLGELVKAMQLFEIEKRGNRGNQSTVIYIRDQRKKRLPETPSLSIDPVFVKHWDQFFARYNEGDSLDGVIEKITPFLGLFITMPIQGLKGLLHKSNLPEDFLTRFKIGQTISVTIKAIRKEKYQVELQRNPSLCEED
ncbi:hypothetical protein Despr_1516 [Desulfobulbus propionicus DSM 2032]|uniref:Maebl n=1 Tax=Desulfobulbus propionicus (strain ATCC 33891 / DSM 2032 / VKM B-1956 / 1pr3) TaxID=577650 RepID=A0A7U3YLQ0_DESPD|nr:hypothetical protein Despr_1516 [Desulfobulbus propionicus DSM 2032]